jgi:hypothetical protein
MKTPKRFITILVLPVFMRHRAFAFKGKKVKAKEGLEKILKKKKMVHETSGDAISFKGPGMSPIIGYFGLLEDDKGKVTHVEMYVKTAWWFYMLSLVVSVAFFVLAYFLRDVENLLVVLAFVVGLFQFAICYLMSIILEKKAELMISHNLYLKKFF